MRVSDMISEDIRTVDAASDWLITNLGTIIFVRYQTLHGSSSLIQLKFNRP